MGDRKDDAKKAVLARRARFVTAALASVSLACGKENEPPRPCLSQVYIPPDGGEPPPQPCLSPMPADAGEQAPPRPCLEPMPPDAGVPPQPCLVPPPPDAGPPPPGPPPRPCLSPKRPGT